MASFAKKAAKVLGMYKVINRLGIGKIHVLKKDHEPKGKELLEIKYLSTKGF